MQFKLKLLVLLAIALLFLSGCAGSVIQTVQTSFSGSKLTTQRVEQAILDGMAANNWRVRSRQTGIVVAELDVGRQQAAIEIAFDETQYTIEYVSSKNLDESTSGRGIHPNYNKWVQELDAEIQSKLTQADGG
ncbi:MAG: hypothetical protein AB8B96_05195 [Lysobacterales bacterium]